MSWNKNERQMIRDGMSWGDVWMLRNPEYILESANRMIEEMRIKEIWNRAIEKEVVVLDPPEVYNKGIIGYCEESNRLIYGYNLLVRALALEHLKEHPNSTQDDCDASAIEWLQHNTMGTDFNGYPIILQLDTLEDELEHRESQTE